MAIDINTGWYSSSDIPRLVEKLGGGRITLLHNYPGNLGIQTTQNINDRILLLSQTLHEADGISLKTQIESVLQNLQSHRPNQTPNKILIPLVVGSNHFTSLVIIPDRERRDTADALYINSFGNGTYADDTKQVKEALKQIYAHGEFITNDTRFQFDGHSCGPITTNILTILGLSNHPRIVFRDAVTGVQANISTARIFHADADKSNQPARLPHWMTEIAQRQISIVTGEVTFQSERIGPTEAEWQARLSRIRIVEPTPEPRVKIVSRNQSPRIRILGTESFDNEPK